MRANVITRFLAIALVLCTVIAWLPANTSAEATTYVLDASTDLTAFNASDNNAGQSLTCGTNNYFTLLMTKKTKVDSSKKTFSDGYAGTQRINYAAKTTFETDGSVTSAIQITTSGAATVKIWWVCGDNGRQVAVYNADGTVASQSEIESTKNDMYISTLPISAAGTYYIGNVENTNYHFRIEVTEGASTTPVEPTPSEPTIPSEPTTPPASDNQPTEAHFDVTTDVVLDGENATTDKAVIPAESFSGFFKLFGKVTQRYDATKGGVYAIELDKNSGGGITFTVASGYTADLVLKVSSTGGSNTSPIALVDADGNPIENEEKATTVTGTAATTLTYKAIPAGTYKILSPEDSNNKRGTRLMSIDISFALSENGNNGDGNPDGNEQLPETGDLIAVALAALAFSGTGIAVLTKKKEY